MSRIIFLVFFLSFARCFAQPSSPGLLKSEFTIDDLRYSGIWKSITSTNDTTGAIQKLEQDATDSKKEKLANRVNLFKCVYTFISHKNYHNIEGIHWAKLAMDNAIRLDDDIALTHSYYWYSIFMIQGTRLDTGVLYYLKSLDLYLKNGRKPETLLDQKIYITTYLFRLRNYDLCKQYCLEAINEQDHIREPSQVIIAWNNLGLYYEKVNDYDSSILCFQKVAQEARHYKKTAWYGLSVGNIGDAYEAKGDTVTAMRYWRQDYDTSLFYGSKRNAGLTLSKMSLYDFRHGDRKQAMRQLDSAIQWSEGSMLVLPTVYRIKSECYKILRNTDSALHYLQLYHGLADSIDGIAARNSSNYLRLKLNFDETTHQNEILEKEKKSEILIRNLVIAGIIVLFIIASLLYNRQRLKHRHEKQLALEKQRAAEADIAAAREQLVFFTRNMLEKNEMIAKLHEQLDSRQRSANDELAQHTILTEDDWIHFRGLFEKVYPGFFERLKTQWPDITTAEIRLAALIRLKLDNKQIASMQGISPVTVRSTKSRLRQRLTITVTDDLESYIQSL